MLWRRSWGLTPILHPMLEETAPFLPYQQQLYCPSSLWLPVLSGRVGGGRELLCVRQINLLSVSGPIRCQGQSALSDNAAQQIKSNQIEISLEMFEQLLVHERLSCWAGLHLFYRASSQISCFTLFPSRRCLICTSPLQQGIIKMSAEGAPRVFRLICLVNLT